MLKWLNGQQNGHVYWLLCCVLCSFWTLIGRANPSNRMDLLFILSAAHSDLVVSSLFELAYSLWFCIQIWTAYCSIVVAYCGTQCWHFSYLYDSPMVFLTRDVCVCVCEREREREREREITSLLALA
jgi:hypothetical protein